MTTDQRAPGVTPRTVAFPDELWTEVARVAAFLDVSASALVRMAVDRYIEVHDEQERTSWD